MRRLMFLMVFVFLIPLVSIPQPNLVFQDEVGLYGVEYDSTKYYYPPSYPDSGDLIYCLYKVINIGDETSESFDIGYETWVNGDSLRKGIYTYQAPLATSDTFFGTSGFWSKETGQLIYDPTVEYKIRLTIDPNRRIVESDTTDNVLETIFYPKSTKIDDNHQHQSVVEKFNLAQNYPNPFNPVTTINYNIAKSGQVQIMVYNISGQVVAELVNDFQPAGSYQVQFEGSQLPSGIYFYKLEIENNKQIRKMNLIK